MLETGSHAADSGAMPGAGDTGVNPAACSAAGGTDGTHTPARAQRGVLQGAKRRPPFFGFACSVARPPHPPFTVSFSVVSVPRGPPWPENVKLKIPELNGPSIPRGAMKPCAIRPRPPGRGSPLGPRVRTADPRAASHSAAASVIRCPVLVLGQPPVLRNDGPKRRSRDSGIRGCPREARALYEAACGRGQRHL